MKICNKIIDNIKNINEIEHYHIQKIILEQDELLKKMIIGITDHHEEITIATNNNLDIKDGDIIYLDGHNIIMVIINSNKLIVIIPNDLDEMGYIAHNLGNRHIPCQFIDNQIFLVYDYLIEEWLKNNNYKYKIENTKLSKPFKYATLS